MKVSQPVIASAQESSVSYPSPLDDRVVILAGPSAVGKSTVIKHLRTILPSLFFSVSVTTRQARVGEKNGVDYHFVTDEEFDRRISNDLFLEWAWIHNGLQRSGTPREPVECAMKNSQPVLIEVDIAGALAIKAKIPQAHGVFVMPPRWKDLEKRIKGRGSELPDVIARRLGTAKLEMVTAGIFDTVMFNHNAYMCAENISRLYAVT